MGRTSGLAWPGLLALALAVGCGGSSGDDDDDDIVIPDADTTAPDAPPNGDGNDSFDDAEEITVDGAGGQGVIQEPLDHDFFKFSGTEGAWLQIVTVANPMDDLEKIDTVIQLYDASMTMIAENDDAVPRVSTDSELALRLPATGTYYLEIQEFSDWDPGTATAEGDPAFTYQVLITTLDPDAPGILEETTDAGDTPGTAVAAKFNMGAGMILGDLNGPTDVDVYSLAMGASGGVPILISSAVAPGGNKGYGSTTSVGDIYITDAAGTQVLAKIDGTDGRFALSPPVAENTTYLLWVEHPGGSAGANDFYFYRFFTGQENPAEAETVAGQNDAAVDAEVLTPTMGSHFIAPRLTTDADVDYFSFQATAGQMISVACTARSSGSGVQGFRAAIHDAADTQIAAMNEPATQTLFIDGVTAPSGGAFYLRLSKTGQDAAIDGDWARCGVHVE